MDPLARRRGGGRVGSGGSDGSDLELGCVLGG